MRLLLDTHAFAWWLTDDKSLPALARLEISRPDNDVWISAVTVFEAAAKHRLGKWPAAAHLLAQLEPTLQQSRIQGLPINLAHARMAGSLNGAHRDPFDRILAAQSLLEGMTLVTGDRVFEPMGVRVLWSQPLS